MSEYYAPAPELYYAARGRIQSVRSALSQWKAREPSDRSDATRFVEVLERGCDRLQQLADDHLTDWKAGQKDRVHIEETLAFLTASAAQLSYFISFLEARTFDRGMPEIALPLKLLLGNIVPSSKQHSFVFFATHDFNFYYSDFYQGLRRPLLLMTPAEEKAFLAGFPEHIALVAYSSIERQNILTLIILIHELSHYADRVLRIRATGPRPRVGVGELNAWLAEAKRIRYVPDELIKQFGSATKVPKGVLDFFLKYLLLRQLESADVWTRELVADALAARILGLGFFLTQKKFLGFFPGDDQSKYPPHYRRFSMIAEELLSPIHGVEVHRPKGKGPTGNADQTRALKRVFKSLRSHYKEAASAHSSRVSNVDAKSPNEHKIVYLRLLARDVIEKAIAGPMQHALKTIRTLTPATTTAAKITDRVFEVADLLTEGIAPSQNLERAISDPPACYTVQEVLNGAWVGWIGTQRAAEDPKTWADRLAAVSRLALRGIELAHFLSRYPKRDQTEWVRGFKELPQRSSGVRSKGTGVLRRVDLTSRMLTTDWDRRLTISPINHAKQIGESSVDVRLGNGFLIVATTRTPSLTIGGGGKIPANYYESHTLDLDDSLLLHPREFILGSTLEYLAMPLDLMAYVIGRSTLGRLGLVIATATHVAPGYKGTLTLELTNVGTVPLTLRPGIRVAQLVFHSLTGKAKKAYAGNGRYGYSVGPEIPKI